MSVEMWLLRFGCHLGKALLLLVCVMASTKAEGVGNADEGVVTWSLTAQDFVCLQDSQACSAAGHASTRGAVDMRPCAGESAGKVSVTASNQIPACFFEYLADLQGVDFASPELFWEAVKAKFVLANYHSPTRQMIEKVIDRYIGEELDAATLKKARGELGIWGQFESLNGRSFKHSTDFKVELSRSLAALGERLEPYRAVMMNQARKVHRYDAGSTVQWRPLRKTEGALAGEVYGFMPFWLAAEKRVIDFGAQTRLGYYAVSFDERGSVTHDEPWRALNGAFAQQLDKAGGKLDMVVYRNDWAAWARLSGADKQRIFSTLADDIVKRVEIPRSHLFSRLKPYLTLGLSDAPVLGDGVTLYFEHYPQDAESVEAFTFLLDALSNKLDTTRRSVSLNIMLHSDEMGKGIYDYERLHARVAHPSKQNLKTMLLVMLQEPTMNNKKQLRFAIENALHGEQRQTLLRHTVMVLSFDGHNVPQLEDDIIYAKDNFGGVGFWMQPATVNTNEVNATIAEKLHERYQQ